jgi:hypothetical protein
VDDVSPHERRQIETFSFFFRMKTGEPKPPKQTFEEQHMCHECGGEGYLTNTTRIRHQHPADEWTIPSLLPISLNGSFT